MKKNVDNDQILWNYVFCEASFAGASQVSCNNGYVVNRGADEFFIPWGWFDEREEFFKKK